MSDNVKIIKDFGAFGDGKWQKHLTLVSWFGKEPVYDLRQWDESMDKCAKGITLSRDDLYDLYNILEDILDLSDKGSDTGDTVIDAEE